MEYRLTYLIASPDSQESETIADWLLASGQYNCMQAEEGAEAWSLINHFTFDLIISRRNLPELDGMALLRLLRSKEELASIPFILLTEQISQKLVFVAGRMGINGIILCPYTRESFMQKIEGAMAVEYEKSREEAKRHYREGLEQMKTGRYDEALQSFDKTLSVLEHPEIYYNMGYILAAKQQFDEALVCFRKAVRIDNDYAQAYRRMADIYLHLDKTDEAAMCLQKAANIFMTRRQDQEAEDVYEALIKFKPNTVNVYNSLGIIYRRQGRLADALEQYRKGLKVHPQDENILFNMSRVYQEMGDIRQSRQHLQAALEINPDFGPARDRLRALELGYDIQ